MPACYSYLRFSTPEQAKGDSLRRQLEASEAYAKERGWALDTSLRDEGKSAFKGEHLKEGSALNRFLERVKNGEIEPGSVLIVESFDRLSRESVTKAMPQFFDIINSGIKIVTLLDRQEYDKESIAQNTGKLFLTLGCMLRANDESQHKSDRLKAAWEENRKQARTGKKLSKICPMWMELTHDKTQYSIIPARAEQVRRMFAMYLNGIGPGAIARQFNKERLPVWGRSKMGWRRSIIHKTLRNRAAIGEMQPKKFDSSRKSVPAGDPIHEYYPSAISEEDFYKAQKLLEENKTAYGQTAEVRNLFGGISKCGYCDNNAMRRMNHANKKGYGPYFVCSLARRGGDCKYSSINYAEFEEGFLRICTKLRLEDILRESPGENRKKINDLAGEMVVAESKLEEIKRQIKKWVALAGKSDAASETLIPEIEQAQASRKEFELKIKEIKRQIVKLENLHSSTETRLIATQDAIHQMQQVQGEELINLRKKIRSKIRELVEKITVYPKGLPATDKSKRSFRVRFKDGGLIVAVHDGTEYRLLLDFDRQKMEDKVQNEFAAYDAYAAEHLDENGDLKETAPDPEPAFYKKSETNTSEAPLPVEVKPLRRKFKPS